MIVLDPVAAIEMARGTKLGLAFRTLLEPKEQVCAPDCLFSDVLVLLQRRVAAGDFAQDYALILLKCITGIVERQLPVRDSLFDIALNATEWEIDARKACYITIARQHMATLFTNDEETVRICDEQKVDCTREVLL